MILLDYYKIGQRIRRIRKAQRLSQEQLAERVGISTTHMSHIETGNTKLSLPVLVELSKVLCVGTDDLLFNQPSHPKETALDAVRETLDACSPNEVKIIAEIIRSTKTALDKYQ